MKLLITKAAALVLLWTLCYSIEMYSLSYDLYYLYQLLEKHEKGTVVTAVFLLLSFLLAFTLPLSGWLADQKLGNFKVFRAGYVLMFLGSVLVGVCILIGENTQNQVLLILIVVLGPTSYLISISGSSACLVTIFQLGLDQMPDASSTDITSYILFFITITYFGLWTGDLLYTIIMNCADRYLQTIRLLVSPVCMCFALSSLFLFGKKWLIIEPKTPQTLKNIYRIFKFAAKHKSPLNRSALTYWEENIPSRLDLGKSRYGGPFTTEQVEDVKTFFRMLLLLMPVWIVIISASSFGTLQLRAFDALEHYNTSIYVNGAIYMVTYCPWWCGMVTLLFYKFCICSCFRTRMPSMLKKLGFYLFLLLLISIPYAVLVYFFNQSIWLNIVHTCLYSSVLSLAIVTSIEFVCAQSPYNMRGLLSGLYLFLIFLVIIVILAVNYTPCTSKNCLIILHSIGGGLGIAGFLLYLIIAIQYKRRVRDEEYIPYPVIEATYDRYLTQARNTWPYSVFYNN